MTLIRYHKKSPVASYRAFEGFRVAVSVDSRLRQAYYSFSKYDAYTSAEIRWLEQKAKACEAEWKADSRRFADKKARLARPTARARTSSDVRGIYASCYKKKLASGKRRSYPVWVVSAANTTPRQFYVESRGDFEAFALAVEYLCTVKKWSDKTAKKLKARWRPHCGNPQGPSTSRQGKSMKSNAKKSKLTKTQAYVLRWLEGGHTATRRRGQAVEINGSRVCNTNTMQVLERLGLARHEPWPELGIDQWRYGSCQRGEDLGDRMAQGDVA